MVLRYGRDMAVGTEAVNETSPPLIAGADIEPPVEQMPTGILPSQALRQLIRTKAIRSVDDIEETQIQPSSLDLRLGATAYRVRASFLPGPETSVQARIDQYAMHEIDLTPGAVLEKGCVYVVPLMEALDLHHDIYGIGNPKSSIGRLDVFTRLITDRAVEFDQVRPNYHGPLYAEICPLAFSIVVRRGSRLGQLRLKRGSPVYGSEKLRALFQAVRDPEAELADTDDIYRGGFPITVDIAGAATDGLIGYKARKHAPLLDVDRIAHYRVVDFWEPVQAGADQSLILDPDDFFILASRERITVPSDHAAEMVAYDTQVGEFRIHYAGFFDPGFGQKDEGGGTRAVLEVRAHEVPFCMTHGQLVGRLVYERLATEPDKVYGGNIGSSYQQQGLTLSKHFTST